MPHISLEQDVAMVLALHRGLQMLVCHCLLPLFGCCLLSLVAWRLLSLVGCCLLSLVGCCLLPLFWLLLAAFVWLLPAAFVWLLPAAFVWLLLAAFVWLLPAAFVCCDCTAPTGDCVCMSHISLERVDAIVLGLASSDTEADGGC